MDFRWPWSGRKTAPVETRSSAPDVPEKVYVEKDRRGYGYEYSEYPPPMLSPGLASLEGRIENLITGYYSSQNFIELFYSLPEIFAPVNEIASRVADCNWQLRKSWNDEVDYNDPDFNKLFSQPNPLNSFKDFVYQVVCYELLTGKAFQYINRPDSLVDKDYRSVVAWWNLPAQHVAVDMKPNVDIYSATAISDLVNQYTIAEGGQTRKFTPDKVLPLMKFNIAYGNKLSHAKSPLCGAEKAIRNLLPVYEARGVIYIKRGALGFMVSKKSDETGLVPLTKGEKEQAMKDVQGTYGVTGDRHPIGVTSMPLEWVRTAMSIEELQPFEETLADAVAIYATLRVPRHLVPSKDNSTFSNADADLKNFYSNVIIPYANRLAQAWTTFLGLDANRRYVHADFSHVDILQENKKEKADVDKTNGATYLQAWQNGVCTLNDWLVARGDKKVSGNPIYEKKIFELLPEELETVKAAINLKSNGSSNTTSKDTGAEEKGSSDKL